MKEIFTQIRDSCPICKGNFGLFYLPFQDADREISKEFKLFQVVRNKIFGFKKVRSLKQLGTYWKVCGHVAKLTSDHENQYTDEDIDFEVKIQVAKKHPSLMKRFKMINGMMYIEPISIAFKNMEHLIACKYFDYAFDIMAEMVGVTVDELLKFDKSSI